MVLAVAQAFLAGGAGESLELPQAGAGAGVLQPAMSMAEKKKAISVAAFSGL